MTHLKTAIRYAVVSAAMLGGAACGDRALAPQPELTQQTAALFDHSYVARGMLVRRTLTLAQDVSASATITPKYGGWLAIPQAGLILLFPPGAVSSSLVVTATAHAGNRVVYTFEPHGTTFNTPVYVAQELQHTELNTPRSQKNRPAVWAGYLYNGLADVLPDGSANFSEVFNASYHGKGNDSYAVFVTTHFSSYAMASGRREPPSWE